MVRTITFVILMGIILPTGVNPHAEEINMGYFMVPPHHFSRNPQADMAGGAAITFFQAAASRMGHTVKWIGPLPLPRLTQYLKTGTMVDGTVGFPRLPPFEKFLYYPDQPLYMGQPIVGVVKEHPLSQIKTIDDIRGFRIGLVKSLSDRYDPLIDDHRDAVYLERLGGRDWMQQNIEKLIADRLDALFDRQQYTMPYVAATLHMAHKIKILPLPSPPRPMFVVFSKTAPKGKMLLDQYNAAVSQVTLDYKQLLDEEMRAVLGGITAGK